MEIKVFGPGCARCAETENLVKEVAAAKGGNITVQKVSDLKEMMLAGVMSTPAVAIDGVVKSTGKVPTKEEIAAWIDGACSALSSAAPAGGCSGGAKCCGIEPEKVCLICGKTLVYSQTAHEAKCSGCGQNFMTNAECESGHFICDACHGAKSMPVIYHYCANTDKRDPYIITNTIMQNPAIPMHGGEHHVLFGSALLAAYYNCGGKIDLPEALTIMRQRGSQLPGGICGLWGNCGAGTSAGIFMSIITGNTPISGNSWRLSNLMTAECLKNIAEAGGPRCCKRDGFLAIKTAVPFIAENLGVQMELTEKIECCFSERNKECLKKQCPFFVD